MASNVRTNAYLSVSSNDISAYCESIDLDESVEQQDDTTMGSGGVRISKPGFKTWVIRATLHQDWANSLLDAILAPLNGTVVAIEFRPTSASVGTSNPKRTGSASLNYTNPLSGGSVGSIDRATLTLHAATALTRATV